MERNYTVSLCMIVKNEEKYLRECLSSIQSMVDEIIIVDTGSTDRTVEIAKEFNGIIDYFEWNDNFSDARNKSLSLATMDWIIIMDADESLFVEDQMRLVEALNDFSYDGYFIKQLNYRFDDQETPSDITLTRRIFKNNKNFKYHGAFHEHIMAIDPQKMGQGFREIDVSFKHKGYLNSVLAEKGKVNRNVQILEKAIQEEPDDLFTLFNLANGYDQEGNQEKAQELYRLFMQKIASQSNTQ